MKELLIRLDPRSPLVVSVRELGRRPGTMRPVELTVPAPEGLGTDVVAVSPEDPIEVKLRLESVMEGVLASGEIHASAGADCVRCLTEVTLSVTASLTELFAYPGRVEPGQDDDEVREVQDELIDLEPALRDAVVLALPFQPVCSADCPGLCAECGVRLADEPEHAHETLDPRWAALQEAFPAQMSADRSTVDGSSEQKER